MKNKVDYSEYFDMTTDYFHKRISNNIKGKVFVRHSVGKTDKCGVPINNLDEVAIKGTVKFYQKYVPFWSCKGKDYVSKSITNPTWLQVCVLANDMIKKTGDEQHIFVEGVRKYKGKAYFLMGS